MNQQIIVSFDPDEKGFIGIAFKNRDLYTLPVPQETTKTIINM